MRVAVDWAWRGGGVVGRAIPVSHAIVFEAVNKSLEKLSQESEPLSAFRNKLRLIEMKCDVWGAGKGLKLV
jgi:hypothetical protein